MDLDRNEEIFEVGETIEEEKGKEGITDVADELRILEAVLFASDELITAAQLKAILPSRPDVRKIRSMVEKINVQLQKERHPFEIMEIGGGFQFRTITYYHPWVRQIFKEKAPKRLSIQALECLAVIAYKQPISKAEIEAIRGVVSDGAMKTLLEKRLINVAGRSDKPGRPLMYGTTQEFLKYFGLNKIEDLPRIEEFEAIAREKMDELKIDEELGMPHSGEDVETTESVGEWTREKTAGTEETPKESSVFEVEITETKESGEEQYTAPPTGDFGKESGDGAGKPQGKEVAEESTKGPEAQAGSDEKHGNAEDLQNIISEEKPTQEKAGQPSNKIKREYIESAPLRGETAFDLDAIIIEEPVIPIPKKNSVDEEVSDVKKTESYDDEAEFEIRDAAAVDELEATIEPVDEDSEKTSPSDLEDVIEEAASAQDRSDIFEEETFEITDKKSGSEKMSHDENELGMLDQSQEEEALFDVPGAAATMKPSETAYFEVEETSAADDEKYEKYEEECEKLAEALKETTIIFPEKEESPKQSAAIRKKKEDRNRLGKEKEDIGGSVGANMENGNPTVNKPRGRRKKSSDGENA